MYKKTPSHRYNKTLKMLKDILPEGGVIYDLGVRNPFSKIMEDEGFKVYNSNGQDFDDDFKLELQFSLSTGIKSGAKDSNKEASMTPPLHSLSILSVPPWNNKPNFSVCLDKDI